MIMRTSGVLLPIFSLPSKYGIGCMSKEAYEFVDFLKESGQKNWQILPLGQTSYGDSPYQSFSTFGCNPYFIDLEEFIKDGYLTREECDSCDFGDNLEYIDYAKIYNERYKLLKIAYNNWEENSQFEEYKEENKSWLLDYALFMAIKDKKDGISWQKWEDPLRFREKETLNKYKEERKNEMDFYMFLQFQFEVQWKKLKSYANERGIKIIGDVPIYVAEDSADAWSNPKLFQFDEENFPTAVAGCPPDAFAITGQLWGNPLYDWDEHKKTNFAWWKTRIAHCGKLYDVVRIDHFRGFDEYYSIPYGDPTAEFGKWRKGPGMELFSALEEVTDNLEIIAEDLGFMTDTVAKLVKDSGFPNMKVIQFGLNPNEDSEYLPKNYDENCVVYTGTHDNETSLGWLETQPIEVKEFLFEESELEIEDIEDIEPLELDAIATKEMVKIAMLSLANTCVIPLQDYLLLDNSARINTPSTLGDNWKWRVTKEIFTKELSKEILTLTEISER